MNRTLMKNKRGARIPGVSRGDIGFTLIELMIVMLIMSILIGIAAIAYDKTVVKARESVLKKMIVNSDPGPSRPRGSG